MFKVPRYPLFVWAISSIIMLAVGIMMSSSAVHAGEGSSTRIVISILMVLMFSFVVWRSFHYTLKNNSQSLRFFRIFIIMIIVPFIGSLHFINNINNNLTTEFLSYKIGNFDLNTFIKQPVETAVMRPLIDETYGLSTEGELEWGDLDNSSLGIINATLKSDGASEVRITGLTDWNCRALSLAAADVHWEFTVPNYIQEKAGDVIYVVAHRIEVDGNEWYRLTDDDQSTSLMTLCHPDENSGSSPEVALHFAPTEINRTEFLERKSGINWDGLSNSVDFFQNDEG